MPTQQMEYHNINNIFISINSTIANVGPYGMINEKNIAAVRIPIVHLPRHIFI